MTVSLTMMKTLNGSAIADSLRGGSSGYDGGDSPTGETAPNLAIFLKHDGSNNIANLSVNVQAYTGTYGGDYSASADLTKLTAHGDAGYGLQCDFRWDAGTLFSTYEQFETGNGIDYASRILVPVTAMSRNNAGSEVDASAPVAGEVGATGDAALGDRAHMTFRYMTPSGEALLGYRQFDILFSFNFTT